MVRDHKYWHTNTNIGIRQGVLSCDFEINTPVSKHSWHNQASVDSLSKYSAGCKRKHSVILYFNYLLDNPEDTPMLFQTDRERYGAGVSPLEVQDSRFLNVYNHRNPVTETHILAREVKPPWPHSHGH